MKKGGVLCVILIILISFNNFLSAQPIISDKPDSIIAPASSMIFIPADWEKIVPDAIETEIADLLTDAAVDLDCIEVIDWLYADDVIYDESIEIDKQIDPSLALFIGESGKIDHVYLFRINSFIQEGRPDEPDDRSLADKLGGFFINLLDDEKKDSVETYAKNIHTEIEVEFDLIDVRRAEIINNFIIQAEFTGGRRFFSHEKTMEILADRIKAELEKNYFLSLIVYNLDKSVKLSRNSNNQSINKGDVFEIHEPDIIEYVDGSKTMIPGKSVGYCRIEEITLRYYRTALLRQWAPIDTGYIAREFREHIYGFSLEIPAPVKSSYYALNMRVFYSPIQQWDWGGVFRVQRVEDSWNELNWGIGFGLFASYRLFNISRFALKARLDADADFFFKNDDSDETVTLALVSLAPGFNAEFVFSKNTDIYFHTGYRFFAKSDEWKVSNDEDEPEIDAYWISSAPEIDMSGMFVIFGLRFLFD
jgi:hypothetical protein